MRHANVRDYAESEPRTLRAWQRVIAMLLGVLFLIATGWYGLQNHVIFVAAADCTDAPLGCAVQVSSEPNAAVLITLVVIAAVWLLIGVGGRVPGFDVAGFGMHLPGNMAAAQFVSPDELPPQLAKGEPDLAPAFAVSSNGLHSRDLYMSLPLEIRLAADSTWSSTFPRSLLFEAAKEMRPERMEGRDVWFISAISPLGEELWLRVIRRE